MKDQEKHNAGSSISEVTPSASVSPLDVKRSMLDVECSPPTAGFFPQCPGETPRAFGAFMAYFQLGQTRSLQSVAEKLGEKIGTVKNWSSKYDWAERLQNYNAGLLQAHAREHAGRQLRQAADWNRRLDQFREQEWEVALQLLSAARCFLDSYGEDDLRRMTLSQVSGALKISSNLARSALAGADLSDSADGGL